MTTLREAAQQALDALEDLCDSGAEAWGHQRSCVRIGEEAIAALRNALAQPEPEPVAWMVYTLDGKSAFVTDNPTGFGPEHKALPLYTTTPQRKPLTNDEIISIGKRSRSVEDENFLPLNFARAIERAHGIGEKE